MMQLKEILKIKGGQPVTVPSTATVADAIRAMKEFRVGSVIVPNADGSPAGIFTERDVLNLCADGLTDFARMSIRPYMTCDMTTGKLDETISEALSVMTAKRFRHLPVIEEGRVIGVVSIGDLVKEIIKDQQFVIEELRRYVSG